MTQTSPKKTFLFMGKRFFGDPSKTYTTCLYSKCLVVEASTYIKTNQIKTMIDVGTGSGSLAIMIALKHPTVEILATDINQQALSEAKKNIQKFSTNMITLVQGSYVDTIEDTYRPGLIIASLPYGNGSFLTPGNTIQRLQQFPDTSYFHPSGDPFGCYIEMIQSILKRGWKTTAIIETGILPRDLIASYLYTNAKQICIEYLYRSYL